MDCKRIRLIGNWVFERSPSSSLQYKGGIQHYNGGGSDSLITDNIKDRGISSIIPQINNQKNLEHGTYHRTINSVSSINPLARKKKAGGASYKMTFWR